MSTQSSTSAGANPPAEQPVPTNADDSAAHLATLNAANSVNIKVVNYNKVYLRIELPNGSVSKPTYLRGTDIDYPINGFNYIDYCWNTTGTPDACTPPYKGRLNAGQSVTF